MLYLFTFYAVFYAMTRFKFAYPNKDKEIDEQDEVIFWFAIWPFALELFVFAWLALECCDKILDKKTSNQE